MFRLSLSGNAERRRRYNNSNNDNNNNIDINNNNNHHHHNRYHHICIYGKAISALDQMMRTNFHIKSTQTDKDKTFCC